MDQNIKDCEPCEVPEHEKRFSRRMMRHHQRAELAQKLLIAAYSGGIFYPSLSDIWYKADELLRYIENESEEIKAALAAETP